MTRKELNQLRITELDKLIKEHRLPRVAEGRLQKVARLLAYQRILDRKQMRREQLISQEVPILTDVPPAPDGEAVSIRRRGRPKHEHSKTN